MKTAEMIARRERELSWIRQHAAILESLPFDGEFWYDRFDFNRLKHAQVLQVIQAFGGQWEKTPNEHCVDYLSKEKIVDYYICCYMGEAPPSCQIIETEEFVPAQPAGVRKVRKLVCPEGVA